ncbi:hypothetical protein Mic7113_2934 [Allocoleopsis franciscana PCC 7113]|uniref:Uncharacterized protein n=1 Tax=Allocoleopsis franciscana PCC 7113 TaxID=1173027 RepID=K9WE86_9CYAN|nr:hypothetical protein Mic7113_2934 [Allocoleopsis franciscana PCC 7113]
MLGSVGHILRKIFRILANYITKILQWNKKTNQQW